MIDDDMIDPECDGCDAWSWPRQWTVEVELVERLYLIELVLVVKL